MHDGHKPRGWRRYLCAPKLNASIYVAAFFVLAAGAVAETASTADGFVIEAGGVKISLQFASPEGTKVIFQRADEWRR